jgi:hypothetical protein
MEGSQRQEKGKGKVSCTGTLTSQSTSMRSRQGRGDRPLVGQMWEPKKRKSRNAKPGLKPREGVIADKDFSYVSQIVPKPYIYDNSVWVEAFLDQLLRNSGDGYRPIVIFPSQNDRAHDHHKRMCIY